MSFFEDFYYNQKKGKNTKCRNDQEQQERKTVFRRKN